MATPVALVETLVNLQPVSGPSSTKLGLPARVSWLCTEVISYDVSLEDGNLLK